MQILSAPVVSTALNEAAASRSSPDAGAPPFNAVLQQELAARQPASAKSSPQTSGNTHPASRSTAAAPKPAEPAIAKAVLRNAADDVQALEAGIATLSAELAAMVTNMLQLHAGAAPAAEDGDSMPGNIPLSDTLSDNAAQLASLALALHGVHSDVSAPPDSADPAAPGTAAQRIRTGKADLAEISVDISADISADAQSDSKASLMQARSLTPDAPLALQAARSGASVELRTGVNTELSAELSAGMSTGLSANLSADPAPLPGFATVLQAAGSAVTSSVPTAAPAPSATLTPPPGTAAWNQALAQRVTWMVSGAEQSATLTLNPPELGPLHIVLNLSHAHADASFIASQPEVRQALEAALPKLRDMLSEAGIELGQASVSSGTPDSNGQFSQDTPRNTRAPRTVAANALPPEPAAMAGRGMIGLIDTFA